MRWVISDLHLGHKRILEFSPGRLGEQVESAEHHDNVIEERWHSTINKKDTVFVLGDVAFSTEALQRFSFWPGQKILVRGNHDMLGEGLYRAAFYKIYGLLKKDGIWFSHAPMHPIELRGKVNVHGHVHDRPIPDKRYIPVCVEQCHGWPIDYESILEKVKSNAHRKTD